MFYWRDRPERAGAEWAFTDAAGGVSRGSCAGLNLGGHVGDDPADVEANREALASELGLERDRLLFMRQVHGTEVLRVDRPWSGEPPETDGIVTTEPGLALAVLVADCVPVLLADPEAGVVGAVHAGRPGMLGGVVDRALDVMAEAGARRVAAAVGPSVCGRCYEVPASMRAQAAEISPVSATVSWTGTPAIDVAAGVVERLHARGVELTWVAGCTRESDRLYSYRRSADTGRFAGVVFRDAA